MPEHVRFPFKRGDRVIYCGLGSVYMSISKRHMHPGNEGRVLAVRLGFALVKFKGFSWAKQMTNDQIEVAE